MQFNVHPFKDIDDARSWARDMIDGSASAARSRFLTLIPGQDDTYRAKYSEACSYISADYVREGLVLPWLEAEAESSGMSLADTAYGIKLRGDRWNLIFGPRIEAQRVSGKARIAIVQTIPDVVHVARLVARQLDQIVDII